MSSSITLDLPDDVIRRAELLSKRTGRPVADLLSESIELSFRPLAIADPSAKSPSEWTDGQVLDAVKAELTKKQDERLTELLDCQQAGQLTDLDRTELAALMEIYENALIHKAQAVQEAVRRGLWEPPQP
jgi:hypothetical protein